MTEILTLELDDSASIDSFMTGNDGVVAGVQFTDGNGQSFRITFNTSGAIYKFHEALANVTAAALARPMVISQVLHEEGMCSLAHEAMRKSLAIVQGTDDDE